MIASGAPLSDWLAWLETLSPTEIDLGLERVQVMLERLAPAIPEHVLLIAGTNGKGSSVAMSNALLRASGRRVGAYTSPHVNRYNERIVVDGAEVSDADIVSAFERIEALREDIPLTYFEYGTLAAIEVFAAAELDVWILEVGLGGRLDATNALDPSASLITNISLDHCDWLGDDVESIAKEKAGIMRSNIPTVFGGRNIPDSIIRCAANIGARLLVRGRDFDLSVKDDGTWSWQGVSSSLDSLRPPGLTGEFQIANAAAVLALLASAGLDSALNEELINGVMAKVRLAGRLQHRVVDNCHWIFDVAHNPAAAQALAMVLTAEPDRGEIVAIVGILDDKDIPGVIEPLRSCVNRWIAVTADSHRAAPARELARQIANLCDKACVVSGSVPEAIQFSRQTTAEDDRIVVTGSFHTVGPALAHLGLSSRPTS